MSRLFVNRRSKYSKAKQDSDEERHLHPGNGVTHKHLLKLVYTISAKERVCIRDENLVCSQRGGGHTEAKQREEWKTDVVHNVVYHTFFFQLLTCSHLSLPPVSPQVSGSMWTPSPTRTPTKPSVNSLKKSTPPASRSKRSSASVSKLPAVFFSTVLCECSSTVTVQADSHCPNKHRIPAVLSNQCVLMFIETL